MTTTPTASPELPDLDRLEALARAATPGPWAYQEDSDAYTHIVRPVASLGRIIASATQTSKPEGEANGRWIAAANPAAVRALIATARRNERMFMAACVDLGLINEALGLDPEDGGADPILDAIEELKAARRDPPEGEAPQAISKEWCERMAAREIEADVNIEAGIPAPAAQHAESGAQAAGWQSVPTSPAVAQGMWGHMELTLRRAMTDTGYNEPADIAAAKQWNGNATHVVRSIIAAATRHAEMWPNAALAAKAEAPAPSAAAMDDVVDNLREYADNAGYSHNDYQDTMRQAANTIEALRAQIWNWGPGFAAQQTAPSAPGTPEAPKGGA